MAETILEFSGALYFDAPLEANLDTERLLSGQLELFYDGQWMSLNDALAVWLLSVLPEEVNSTAISIELPARTRSVVTATQLNVRARPGVSPDNPVVDQLPQYTSVFVYEERAVEGEVWCRIGPDRWVHGQYLNPAGLGGGGGVSSSGRVRWATGVNAPRKATRTGSTKPASDAG